MKLKHEANNDQLSSVTRPIDRRILSKNSDHTLSMWHPLVCVLDKRVTDAAGELKMSDNIGRTSIVWFYFCTVWGELGVERLTPIEVHIVNMETVDWTVFCVRSLLYEYPTSVVGMTDRRQIVRSSQQLVARGQPVQRRSRQRYESDLDCSSMQCQLMAAAYCIPTPYLHMQLTETIR